MSQKEQELLDKIENIFDIDGKVQRERRIWIKVNNENPVEICEWLRDEGFIHLSSISATDWNEEDKFEITYHTWSYDDSLLVTLKTEIDRDNPKVDSVQPVWKENAQIHERELHELFGIDFEGNEDLAPLFLEDWTGPPPFRKDFDWREFVRDEFYNEENERERVYFDRSG
ncbi:MAG: NADH-quinone oxidoreductase subunit C [Thermoplasmatota archaeon]